MQYRDAVLVFAELTRGQITWFQGLEGWQMRESQYIKSWQKVGEVQGTLQARREDLLKIVMRLENPVPEPVRLAIEGTNDPETLSRWVDVALDASTLADFRRAMNPTP